jgi:23S rRNA (uridine2552-2'-O)-methyltransferase
LPKHRPQDHFGRRAKAQGYAARSVFKLQEIDEKLRLLRPGQRVLDLGAAPGSWAQHASQRVGERGVVIAVDLEPLRVSAPNLRCAQRDIAQLTADDLFGITAFDVVLSDMAPHTSGQRHRDQYLSFELYLAALRAAERWLAPGGFFVGKLFQGAEFEEARAATRALLGQARILKPTASRSESYEIFLAGGPRPAAKPAAQDPEPSRTER